MSHRIRVMNRLTVVSLWSLAALCLSCLAVEARRAGGWSRAFIATPTASFAPAASQKRRSPVKRRTRRRRSGSSQTARRVSGKPREIQGVIVDTNDNAPDNSAATGGATAARPKRPISGGVLNGRAISLPHPAYPPIARAARASGTVVVQVTVDEEGRVTDARAVSGHPLLQTAAVEAARQARFSPTTLGGEPVRVTGVITFNFVP